jgi:hypothetical protein
MMSSLPDQGLDAFVAQAEDAADAYVRGGMTHVSMQTNGA